MLHYVVKRCLMLVPVIIGISFIVFSIMNLTEDPAKIILGEYATPKAVELLREEMGLNKNFFIRYGTFLAKAATGDFGNSYTSGLSVTEEVANRFPTTLKLTLFAISLSILFGVPAGIISAVKQYTLIDSVSMIAALLLTSIPGFWLGLILMLVFALKLNLLPTTGVGTFAHYILPSITLAALTMATLIRMTRSTMLEVIRQDYIRTAKAKGADQKRIVLKHALPNALLPVITVIGINFSILIGGAVIVESVFAIPGLGTLVVNAVKLKDAPVVLAAVMLIALIGGVINLTVDVLYGFIDPRLKSQIRKG